MPTSLVEGVIPAFRVPGIGSVDKVARFQNDVQSHLGLFGLKNIPGLSAMLYQL